MCSNNYDFNTLNARKLTPIQVAKTFIPPSYFKDLLENNNYVLVGPRGSGKTTLLKMLDILALANWKHGVDEESISHVNYISVFVPIDIDWEKQWTSSINSLKCKEEIKSQLRIALFTTHVHSCIINTFIDCTNKMLLEHENLKRFYLLQSKEDELKMVNEISNTFNLDVQIPSILGLKRAFIKRLKDLGTYINYFSINKKEPEGNYDFIYDDFFQSIKLIIEIFNEFLEKKEQKWAFAFDELEIAPVEIRKKLFSLLRQGDSRFIFKLSMSPYSEDFDSFTNKLSSSNNNDFKTIHLWYKHKDESTQFCLELFKEMCKAMNIKIDDQKKVFGWSEFELGRAKKVRGQGAYIDSKYMKERFDSLAKKDKSFNLHLKRGKIETRNWKNLSDIQIASKIRKITNIVSIRDAFLSENGGRRTRKNPTLYTGDAALFDLTEGNPRVFITLIGSLLRIYKDKFEEKNAKVDPSVQARKINENMSRYRALVSTIPAIKSSESKYNNYSVLQVLDIIGNYFFTETVVKDFKTEPPLSFIVDKKTPFEIRDLIGKALNIGAIVYMPDEIDKTVINSLEGKRFRLNRLLCPHYRIPMISTQGRALSNILKSEETPSKSVFYKQPSLNLD